jgi:2-methylcitrate dehydratase PrpD
VAEAGATLRLARAVHDTSLSAVPSSARHSARRALVNIVGCCVGGARHDIVEAAARALLGFGGPQTSGLLGRPERSDALTACMLNGLSSAAYSFDDTHADTILHPTGAVAAALLAYAGVTPMRGDDFLLALLLGVDVASRISKAVSVTPAQGPIGWSQTGIAAGIGAAAAVAKAMRLDAEAIGWAIGHAAQQAGGLRVAHGTMAATLIFGNAAQSGLRAALLAQQGLRGPDAPLEGRYGFAELFAVTPHLPHLTDRLGECFEVDALAYKPYPCGVVIHPAVDAALALHAHGDANDPITHARLRTHASALALGFRRHPTDPLQAKVSLYHWTAAALALGRAGLAEGQQNVIVQTEVVRLRELLEAVPDESMASEAAQLTVTTRSGGQRTATIAQCKGSVANPMTDDDLATKFHGQAGIHLPHAQAQALLDACWSVDLLDDVEGLVERARSAAI